jgi:CxxH/CxxC protein (TIGR04129 family)
VKPLLLCLEHAEREMDRIAEEEERPPELLTLEQAGAGEGALCEVCGRPAEYSVR